ncbi:hypothetical protein [Halosimplex marinum]|uniref:hypothetical protein n=1 Tax=Halosimplex marinum TaxID=3396620 RepID=UPI003F56826E
MNESIATHRETALDSPYSRDREAAVEELARSFPSASEEGKREVLETLREVGLDATGSAERELAREKLLDCFEADPETAAPVVVPAFCRLARDGKFTDERLAAVDTLRRVARDAPTDHVEPITETLSDLSAEATSEDLRDRARRRLTDIETRDGDVSGDDSGYLAVSLAEHLQRAAGDSPESCRRRAVELRDFVANHPVDDDAYGTVRDDIDALVEQLDVAPTGDELDDQRRERVDRIAERAKQLYRRH